MDDNSDEMLIARLQAELEGCREKIKQLEDEVRILRGGSVSHEEEQMDTSGNDPSPDIGLYVSDLARGVDENQLREAFAELAPVHSVRVVRDKMTNESKGFGFVQMYSIKDVFHVLNDPDSWPSFTDSVSGQSRKVSVTRLESKNTLSVTRIPKSISKKAFTEYLKSLCKDLDITNVQLGSGAALVQFNTHQDALRGLKCITGASLMGSTLECSVVDRKAQKQDIIYQPVSILFIKGIPSTFTKDEVAKTFNGTKAIIPHDVQSGKMLGHAFVHFPNQDVAGTVMEYWQGKDLGGKKLSLEFALPQTGKKEKGPGSAGGRAGPHGQGDQSYGSKFQGPTSGYIATPAQQYVYTPAGQGYQYAYPMTTMPGGTSGGSPAPLAGFIPYDASAMQGYSANQPSGSYSSHSSHTHASHSSQYGGSSQRNSSQQRFSPY